MMNELLDQFLDQFSEIKEKKILVMAEEAGNNFS
jgi:hypothetical protein